MYIPKLLLKTVTKGRKKNRHQTNTQQYFIPRKQNRGFFSRQSLVIDRTLSGVDRQLCPEKKSRFHIKKITIDLTRNQLFTAPFNSSQLNPSPKPELKGQSMSLKPACSHCCKKGIVSYMYLRITRVQHIEIYIYIYTYHLHTVKQLFIVP